MRCCRKSNFWKIAAETAGISADEHWAAAFEAARDVAGRFGTARVAMLFLFCIQRPGTNGAAFVDFEEIAARTGLPLDIAEALLDDLAGAGYIAFDCRSRWRHIAYPFVKRRPVSGQSRANVRPPVRLTHQCVMQH